MREMKTLRMFRWEEVTYCNHQWYLSLMLSLVAIGDEVSGEEVGLQTVYLEAASNYSLIQMLEYTMAKMGCM